MIEIVLERAFLLSDSSSPELVKQISESLAGRVARLEMAPLSLSEAWQLPSSQLYPMLVEDAGIEDIQAVVTPCLSIAQFATSGFRGDILNHG